jgi:cysteine desulfurase family protein (TIGR01976 family)
LVDSAQRDRVARSMQRDIPARERLFGGMRPVFLDGPGGTQLPDPVLHGMSAYIRDGMAARHGRFATSRVTEDMLVRARSAMATWLGCDGHVIVFGQNMTSLSFAFATSLARDWGTAGGRVVVSEMDHHGNVDPWIQVAADRGLEIAWLPVRRGRLTLDLENLDSVIDERCLLVSVGLASNATGSVQDVARITARAREVGAIAVVDAVQALPHMPVDGTALGADVLFVSAYKAFGPHIGIMAIRPELLDRTRFYKVAPAGLSGPAKAEVGTQNHEAIAGLCSTVEYLASLGAGDDLRSRLESAMNAIAAYEEDLCGPLLEGLADMPPITVWRAPGDVPKVPIVALTVPGVDSGEVARRLGERAIFVSNGDFYATTLARRLGVRAAGGWVRLGIAPYVDRADIARVLDGLRSVAISR